MEINEHNYKDVLLMRLEGELSPEEVLQAEAFILVNEAAAKEWKFLQKTKLQPVQKVFFPKKHLLLKDDEDVIVAPVAAERIVIDQAVVRALSGGINYRKFVIPVSIAASLLLFFFLFNNRSSVDNAENKVAQTEITKPKSGINSAGRQPGTISNSKVNKEGNSVIETGNTKKEQQLVTVNPSLQKQKNKRITDQDEAFSAKDIYGNEEPLQDKSAGQFLAKVIPAVLPVKNAETGLIPEMNIIEIAINDLSNDEDKVLFDEDAFAEADTHNERGIVSSVIYFFRNTLQIKKQTENDQKFYALKFETENIKIVKTFKSNF